MTTDEKLFFYLSCVSLIPVGIQKTTSAVDGMEMGDVVRCGIGIMSGGKGTDHDLDDKSTLGHILLSMVLTMVTSKVLLQSDVGLWTELQSQTKRESVFKLSGM